LKKFNHIKSEEKTLLGDFVLDHFERDTISVKNNYCENVYLSKGYDWNLDNLYNLLNKILREKQKNYPKDSISVWRHRLNQKSLTYERIKYFS